MSQLAKVLKCNWKGLNLRRGFIVAAVLLVLTILLLGLGHEGYVLTFVFAVLFAALSDPGGKFGYRVQRMALFGVLGALLTALGFGIGGSAWGLVVLAVFVVTLLGGLAVRFGLHRFESGELLTYWFLIAISLPLAYKADHITVSTGKETVAWLIAVALWIAITGVLWLARGRKERPPWLPEFPASTEPVKLTTPVVAFAVIRALAPTVAVAIAFGLHVPNADWMPVAALVAMKSNLAQSALTAGQRLTGAILGAGVAALFLLTVHNKYVLGVVIVLLVAAAVSIRTVNYALYCAAIAGSVLIAIDLAHPTDFASEGRRVLFTLAGVGIGLAFTLLTFLLQKRGAKTAS
ncbi:MAG TPA: FUSC family protein, partial [Thermoleophilia bacterium]|nr:FUSC family protein [Thermoleophilia bacterium]